MCYIPSPYLFRGRVLLVVTPDFEPSQLAWVFRRSYDRRVRSVGNDRCGGQSYAKQICGCHRIDQFQLSIPCHHKSSTSKGMTHRRIEISLTVL